MLRPVQYKQLPNGASHTELVILSVLRATKKFFSSLLAKKDRRAAIGGELL